MQIESVLNIEEVKSRLLEILTFFKNICAENGLKYSLAYGTLLGAVRHGGFIPWDDDVDVCMPREDYERLIGILNNRVGERFRLLCAENEPTYYYNFAKIVDSETDLIEYGSAHIVGYGVFIDVFPLDNCPSEQKELRKLLKQIRTISRFRSASVCNGNSPVFSSFKNAIRRTVSPFAKIPGFKYWLNKEEKKIRSYDDIDTLHMTCLAECLSYNEIINKEIVSFDGRVLFENIEFSCFSDYDGYLRGRYGDYMELPPENERIPRHGYKAFLKEVQ